MSLNRRRLRVAMVMCAMSLCSTPAQTSARPEASGVAAQIVDLTNVERTHEGRRPVRANARLMRAAQLHAEQMARARQLAHVLPSGTYPRAADRLRAADYRWQTYGENIALGQAGAAEVLESWMHSRGHRTNILTPDFTEMGAGYAIDRAGRPYYVQVFAAPLP
jgi:uncharacterized protein YkwD